MSAWHFGTNASAAAFSRLAAIACCLSVMIPFSASSAAPADPLEDALVHYAKLDYPDALKMLLPHAASGNPVAQEVVGFMYLRGEGTGSDPLAAIDWLKRAAAAGRTEAQFELGRMYRDGIGVVADFDLALFWFKRAAERGSARAMNATGELYLNIFDSYQAALAWFRQAAQNGSSEAMLNIASQYRFGLGVEADDIEELKWIDLAVRETGWNTFGPAAIARSELASRLTPVEVQMAVNRARTWWRASRSEQETAADAH